ncbi:hypothetical protein BSFA1_10610 [Burkholderia sp. SFA1]|nr:hypothetical protein BSFA1_10610 [Burkholderia sp. SFA1]
MLSFLLRKQWESSLRQKPSIQGLKMKKTIAAALACAAVLAACGGGGDDGPSSTAKVATISYYGNPLPTAQSAQSAAKVAAVAHAASDPAASDAGAQTALTLTQALAAQGVTAQVTPQVINGTTLHALIMGENNGLPPTQDVRRQRGTQRG